ncbi:hypothetical protein BREVUG8_100159 [Brevundimonas sp. G8]|nr:hypothetical protein BREVUG8_100159 [Brevundimonas sp. G8]
MAIAAEAPIMSFAQETPAPNAAGAGLVALTCGEKAAKSSGVLCVTICF